MTYESIEEAYCDSWDIELRKQLKRIDRDWAVKFVWNAKNEDQKLSCDWEGFSDPSDCIADCLATISKIKQKPE